MEGVKGKSQAGVDTTSGTKVLAIPQIRTQHVPSGRRRALPRSTLCRRRVCAAQHRSRSPSSHHSRPSGMQSLGGNSFCPRDKAPGPTHVGTDSALIRYVLRPPPAQENGDLCRIFRFFTTFAHKKTKAQLGSDIDLDSQEHSVLTSLPHRHMHAPRFRRPRGRGSRCFPPDNGSSIRTASILRPIHCCRIQPSECQRCPDLRPGLPNSTLARASLSTPPPRFLGRRERRRSAPVRKKNCITKNRFDTAQGQSSK